ncbi:hypothetical protein COT72_04595 [archaeon CG10_big_fil_rev_8_21_14_0_10_43_11]|nr:MAG: hypothetical protein COT72_04595 [archaeon CG10_big_fil_rev_8_21_14_0_10_43_11]
MKGNLLANKYFFLAIGVVVGISAASGIFLIYPIVYEIITPPSPPSVSTPSFGISTAPIRVDILSKSCIAQEGVESGKITLTFKNIGSRPIHNGEISLTVRDENGVDLLYIENNSVVGVADSDFLDVGDSVTVTWVLDEENSNFVVGSQYGLYALFLGGTSAETTCVFQ